MKAALIKRLRGALAAIAVLCLALTALPATAKAATYYPQSASITIDGVESGDTVELYQIASYTYAGTQSNTMSWKFSDWAEAWAKGQGITKDQYRDQESDKEGTAGQVRVYADSMYKYIADNGPIQPVKTEPATSTSVVFSDMGAGSYLVVVTRGKNSNSTKLYQHSIVNLIPTQDQATKNWSLANANATVKAEDEPTVDKKINGNNGPSSDYAVGDTVPFSINSIVPQYPADSTHPYFAISDTMSDGLQFNDDIEVTVTDTDDTEVTLHNGSDYTLTPNPDGKTFEIVFIYAKISQYAGCQIKVEYSAELTETGSQKNDASVTFSNNPNVDEDYKTVTDTEYVYTYTLSIKKVDADNNSKALQGATFKLLTSDGTLVQDGITTNGSGEAAITGLKAGDYQLVETQAPAGYQLDTNPITFTIEGKSEKGLTDNDLIITKTVTNQKTPSLPITGGSGTIALTAAGVVLVAGAAALIVRTRRNNE